MTELNSNDIRSVYEEKLTSKNVENITNFQRINVISNEIDIEFKNITYSIRLSSYNEEKKDILKGISGLYKSGQMTAVLGPSGSGKTSLLNVLSGFIKNGVGGKMYANGFEVNANRTQTKSKSAYILQNDYFNPFFSVNEIMMHAANIKLGPHLDARSKLELIEHLLGSMSMKSAGDTLCGKLSGGERKRLNVCLELLGNVPILFLDEPTSGLDSTNCMLLVTVLKKLADEGRTIICTIHQPSAAILSMFDHLHFLNSGKTVFHGDVTNLLQFLSIAGLPCPLFHNPADFIMDIVSGEFGNFTDKLIEINSSKNWSRNQSYIHSLIDGRSENPKMNEKLCKNSSNWFIYKCLVKQLCLLLHRDRGLYLKFILSVLCSLLFGLLFPNYGDESLRAYVNAAILFITSFFVSYITLLPATLKFPNTFMVLKKEHFNNWYKFSTYFLAYFTVNITVQILLSFVFISLMYWLTGQVFELKRSLIFLSAVALETIMAEMIGITVGSAQDPVKGLAGGCVILLYFTCMAGLIAPVPHMPKVLQYFSDLSFFKYTFELKMAAAYGYDRGKLYCPDTAIYCHIKYPKMVLDYFGHTEERVVIDFVILCIYTIILIVVAFFSLKYRLKAIH